MRDEIIELKCRKLFYVGRRVVQKMAQKPRYTKVTRGIDAAVLRQRDPYKCVFD